MWDFTQKREPFQKFQTKWVLSQSRMEICEKFRIFFNKLVVSLSKTQKDWGVIVWQICNFWSKTQNTWDLEGWQSKLFRGNWARSEQKRGVLRALHSVTSNMGVPPGFISYYNLNFIKYLLVILVFATLAGGHKYIKEHHACPNKSGNLRHLGKVLNSDFYLCPRSNPHLRSSLINSRDFLKQTAQGRRHIKIKNQILNMADTFLDMVTDSLVPVLSGTHSIYCYSLKFWKLLLLNDIHILKDISFNTITSKIFGLFEILKGYPLKGHKWVHFGHGS